MARQRRPGQNPRPRVQNGQWKISYWADIVEGDQHRRVRRTACLGPVQSVTFTEACQKARQVLQPINDLAPGVEFREKTLSKLVEEWRVAVKPTLRFSTQFAYEWAVKRIEPAFGAMRVADVERAEVQTFLTKASSELAPESVRDLLNRLKGLFTSGEEWGWIAPGANPAKGRKRLLERVPARRRVILTPAEFWLLVEALESPYSTVVILAGLGGLRKGEISALRWNDNPRPGIILVDEAVYCGRLGSPKTPRSRRELPIGEVAQAAIDAWRARARFRETEHFMFGQRKNTTIDLKNAMARYVKPACEAVKLPPIGWHTLRHIFTTWGREEGIRAEVLRDLLGHSSITTTLDRYAHVGREQLEAARRIEQYVLRGRAGEVGAPTWSPLSQQGVD